MHTAMDNVAHGRVQRTTPVQRTDFALAETSKRGIGTGTGQQVLWRCTPTAIWAVELNHRPWIEKVG